MTEIYLYILLLRAHEAREVHFLAELLHAEDLGHPLRFGAQARYSVQISRSRYNHA